MHIKHLRRGAGSAGKAAGYLVGERDAMGREREGVEVLRGDPDMVAAVADTCADAMRCSRWSVSLGGLAPCKDGALTI